ncbi:MAG: hypothetical protein BroJett013_25810 [Alphaproteobacteria bacterium]|nr:MAG: hypothetical protein BroJett013_25810 [Alphaproteobacteria bacterium]
MTEQGTSARAERADAAAARLPWSVCAAEDGDWLIFLDLARNRYRAVSLASAPEIAGVRSIGAPGARSDALVREGLVTSPSRNGESAAWRQSGDADWRDLLMTISAALWARRVVKQGALLEAFCRLSEVKARLGKAAPSPGAAVSAYARFAAARIWIPAAFVCLFDSLTLMRFLLASGVRADLVFGVRSRPFAAHCWVEADGEILDDGGEACHSFVEIVRV